MISARNCFLKRLDERFKLQFSPLPREVAREAKRNRSRGEGKRWNWSRIIDCTWHVLLLGNFALFGWLFTVCAESAPCSVPPVKRKASSAPLRISICRLPRPEPSRVALSHRRNVLCSARLIMPLPNANQTSTRKLRLPIWQSDMSAGLIRRAEALTQALGSSAATCWCWCFGPHKTLFFEPHQLPTSAQSHKTGSFARQITRKTFSLPRGQWPRREMWTKWDFYRARGMRKAFFPVYDVKLTNERNEPASERNWFFGHRASGYSFGALVSWSKTEYLCDLRLESSIATAFWRFWRKEHAQRRKEDDEGPANIFLNLITLFMARSRGSGQVSIPERKRRNAEWKKNPISFLASSSAGFITKNFSLDFTLCIN